ncbi:MAG: hypothetical protein IJT94_04605, partial [Oscillibacter sp.]|nr:hypothetical protein [Oscillibacter sp.]
ELQGMEENVSAVSYAKVVLDLGEGAEDSVSAELPIQFYDAENQLVEPEDVSLSVQRVTATLPVYMTKTLPLKVNFTESAGARLWNLSRQIDPPSIQVSGETSRLRNLDSITLGDLNLLDLVGAGKTTYIYTIPIPDGCTNLSGKARATLEVSFKDMAVREVQATHFSIDDEPADGRSVEVLTESLTVSVFGATQAVGAVEDSDIVVTPDLSDYASAQGVYTVAAAVTLQNTGDVGVSGTYEVQVRIRDGGNGTTGETAASVGTAATEEQTAASTGTASAAAEGQTAASGETVDNAETADSTGTANSTQSAETIQNTDDAGTEETAAGTEETP